MRTSVMVPSLALCCALLVPAMSRAQSEQYHHVLKVQDLTAGALAQVVHPEFPLKAARQGIEKGYVQARLHVDDEGEVTSVEVTRSWPTGAFDRAATGALRQWRFKKGAVGNIVEVSIDFYRPGP
jgi:TonB family protein